MATVVVTPPRAPPYPLRGSTPTNSEGYNPQGQKAEKSLVVTEEKLHARPEHHGEMGLQAHFSVPPLTLSSPESETDTGASVLTTPHNSVKAEPKECLATTCPFARFVKGACTEHGDVHWLLVPCKSRSCDTCGPASRYRIARRIALGVRILWPAAWMVLTFREDLTKPEAVKRLAPFVRWIRKQPGHSKNEYVATYETTKKGRLHINLIIGPWQHISQRKLSDKWGARLWIEWVKNDVKMGNEAAAAYSPEALGGYLAKLQQAVQEGRRVSYSKGWPKLPDPIPTKGEISWKQLSLEESIDVSNLLRLGWLTEVAPGQYRHCAAIQDNPPCDCFEPQSFFSYKPPLPS